MPEWCGPVANFAASSARTFTSQKASTLSEKWASSLNIAQAEVMRQTCKLVNNGEQFLRTIRHGDVCIHSVVIQVLCNGLQARLHDLNRLNWGGSAWYQLRSCLPQPPYQLLNITTKTCVNPCASCTPAPTPYYWPWPKLALKVTHASPTFVRGV